MTDTADAAAEGATPDKAAIRKEAFARRKAQENKDELSRQIVARFMGLPAYEQAKTVLFYVDARSEVRTRHDLPTAIERAKATGQRIVVPWCNDEGELELFHLTDMSELELGMYKILEPSESLRHQPERQIAPQDLDLLMIPGVGFDREGGRTGHGKGYYDKLLEHARPEAPLAALAFECQLFDRIPMHEHDVYMDYVLTEEAAYEGRGRN